MAKNIGFLETTVDFGDRYFSLSGDLAGKVLPFTFKGQHYQVHFPNFDLVPNGMAGGAKVTRRDTKIALNWIEADKRRHAAEYGSYASHDRVRVTRFTASRLIVRSNKPITPAAARKAKQDLAEWRELLAAWDEVIEYRDLESNGIEVEQKKTVEAYFLSLGQPAKVRRIKKKEDGGAIVLTGVVGVPAAKMFRRALKRAATGKYPPDYYSLLIQGLKHFNEKRYRQSLLDVATAVELTLGQMLSAKLAVSAPQHRNRLMKQYRQLSGLTLGLTTLGVTITPDIAAKIGKPRNNAIHAGVGVSQAEARDALQVGRTFIYAHLPL